MKFNISYIIRLKELSCSSLSSFTSFAKSSEDKKKNNYLSKYFILKNNKIKSNWSEFNESIF